MNTRITNACDNNDKQIIHYDIDFELGLELIDAELEFMDMIKQLKPWKASTELTGQWTRVIL